MSAKDWRLAECPKCHEYTWESDLGYLYSKPDYDKTHFLRELPRKMLPIDKMMYYLEKACSACMDRLCPNESEAGPVEPTS